MKKLTLVALIILLSFSLLSCGEGELSPLSTAGEEVDYSDKTPLKKILEEELKTDIDLTEDQLQAFRFKIIELVHAEDEKALLEEAGRIEEDYKEDLALREVYALLFYKAKFEGSFGSDDYPLAQDATPRIKFVLEAEDIKRGSITEALKTVGIISSATEEDLQQARKKMVTYFREKDAEVSAAEDEKFLEEIESMNPLDSMAYLQVRNIAKKEAFFGSEKYPLNEEGD